MIKNSKDKYINIVNFLEVFGGDFIYNKSYSFFIK